MNSIRFPTVLARAYRGCRGIAWRLALLGALVFGAAVATEPGQAQERVPELKAGNFLEMRIGQIYTFSVRSYIGPSEDDGTVIVHLGTDPETGDKVIAFQGNGALDDGQKHVSVYNRRTWWQGQRVTFRAEHAGTVWVTLQTVHPRHHRYHILKVVVKQQPAIVQIEGRPRYRFGAGHEGNHRFQIQKGAYDADHGLTPSWQIIEELEFATGKCDEPQTVTVYGLTDFNSWTKLFHNNAAYVILKHRVTQYDGTAVPVRRQRRGGVQGIRRGPIHRETERRSPAGCRSVDYHA